MQKQQKPKTRGVKVAVLGTIVLLLCLSATISPALAAWTQTSITGTWTASAKTAFGQTDYWHNEYDVIQWEQNLTDFSGYTIDMNTVTTQAIARGWGQTGNMHVIAGIGFFVGTEARSVAWVHYDQSQNIFGKNTVVRMGTQEQFSDSYGNIISGGGDIASFHVVLNTTETTTIVQYLILPYTESMNDAVEWADWLATNLDGANLPQHYEAFNTDLYRENVTVKFFIACSGSGTFSWEEEAEQFFFNGTQPDPIPETNTIGGEPWATKAWNFLTSLWIMATALFELASGLFVGIAPYLAIFFLFWLLDALIASVYTRSFKPIGFALEKILEFVRMAYDAAVGLIDAIANLLPF